MKIYCGACRNPISEMFLKNTSSSFPYFPFSLKSSTEKILVGLTSPFPAKGNLWNYFINFYLPFPQRLPTFTQANNDIYHNMPLLDNELSIPSIGETSFFFCENCFKSGFIPHRCKDESCWILELKTGNESNFHYFTKQILLNFINNHYVDEIVYKNFHLPLSSCFALAEYKIPKAGNPKEFHGEGWFNGDISSIKRIPDIAVFDKDKMRKNTGDELTVVFEADFDHEMDEIKKNFYTTNRILYFEPDLLIMQALFGMNTKGKKTLNLEYLNYVAIEDFLEYQQMESKPQTLTRTDIPRSQIMRSTNYEQLYGET